MNVDKIKFAIVGFGHIGKRHAAMINSNTECDLVAVCDCNETAMDVGLSGQVKTFSKLTEMLNSGIHIDVLSIATPNGFHEEHALLGINAGCHVVIEKPMALTREGCERILFNALHHHKLVFCVMQNRYSPPSVWLRNIVQNNNLGKIFFVQINCYWNRDERYYTPNNWHGTKELDGGTLFTQFSHYIDILYWIFGDIKEVKSRLYDFNHQHLTEFEDSGVITFELVSGGLGVINFSTAVWDKNLESSITVIGEKGTAKIGGQYMNDIEHCHIKDYEMPILPPSNPPNDYGSYKGSAANHHYVFENVVDVLKGRGPITTNALEGMKVVEIIERIYQSKLS